ncbi:MAG TPA: hypothetical protein P5205_01415 [Candidatus Paceibacterota bacterium]|nr:hypothetical protein [Verrucomicrobiota bacterium]HSA09008.1 hypothetical protein [Candidatus Paceibacterota bacterium]
MSEFKFACPVCGQHITADASTSGGQIDCPTCFQKIVVPQAPGSQETKFILSASQVAKPRPVAAEGRSGLGPLGRSTERTSLAALVALLLLLGGAGAALYVFRDRIFKPALKPPPAATNAVALTSNAPVAINPTHPIPTNIAWTLEPAKATIPETTAAGSIHGSGFLCERTTVQGGILSLRQGRAWPPDLGITLIFPVRPGEELTGKTIEIAPGHPRPLRIVLRWKDEQQESITETFRDGYVLKISFGQPAEGRLPGRLYLGLPDAARSFVAGTFEAEIRKPQPPKSGSPKSPRPPRPKR